MKSAQEIRVEHFGKECTTKKGLLEYLQVLQKLPQATYEEAEWVAVYKEITEAIEAIRETIKVNTVAQLQKERDAVFRKKLEILPYSKEHIFIYFLKEAYPAGQRDRLFTKVLTDPMKATEDQLLHTFKYISNYSLENKLSKEEIKSLVPLLRRLHSDRVNKYVLQLKSLEGLRKIKEFDVIIQKMGGVSNTTKKKEYGRDYKNKGNKKEAK